jgi:hypothetical protein
MSSDRIKYRNLGEIFVIQLEDKNIEVGTIGEEYYQTPFNKYVIIKNIYKYPERVKEYAEACQFTNAMTMTGRAPLLRTYAPMNDVFEEIVTPVLYESLDRKLVKSLSNIPYAEFSYYDPQSIVYHKYQEPHMDTAHHSFPAYCREVGATPALSKSQVEILAHAVAGNIFLDDTFGTELLVNKNISYYHTKALGSYGLTGTSNDNYYPEGNNSHYESVITIGGEYNSAVFYYGDVPHRPDYLSASDEDLKRGRLIQNFWIDDITDIKERSGMALKIK